MRFRKQVLHQTATSQCATASFLILCPVHWFTACFCYDEMDETAEINVCFGMLEEIINCWETRYSTVWGQNVGGWLRRRLREKWEHNTGIRYGEGSLFLLDLCNTKTAGHCA